MSGCSDLLCYKDVLQMALTDKNLTPDEDRLLAAMRVKLHIDDEEHEKILNEMGWSKEEYDQARKGRTRSPHRTQRWRLSQHSTAQHRLARSALFHASTRAGDRGQRQASRAFVLLSLCCPPRICVCAARRGRPLDARVCGTPHSCLYRAQPARGAA